MNRFMPEPPQAAPQMAPGGPPMGQPAPQMGQPPQGPPPAPPTAEQIAQARTHTKVMVADLTALVRLPPSKLTKKAVFDAAADMIAKGAFPTPDSRQNLIVELAQLPDDEGKLRQVLGGLLLQLTANHVAITQAFGEGG